MSRIAGPARPTCSKRSGRLRSATTSIRNASRCVDSPWAARAPGTWVCIIRMTGPCLRRARATPKRKCMPRRTRAGLSGSGAALLRCRRLLAERHRRPVRRIWRRNRRAASRLQKHSGAASERGRESARSSGAVPGRTEDWLTNGNPRPTRFQSTSSKRLLAKGLAPPPHIRFVTYTTRFNRCFWITVEELHKTL